MINADACPGEAVGDVGHVAALIPVVVVAVALPLVVVVPVVVLDGTVVVFNGSWQLI